jgi:Mg2+ and Co2+ transporter CorA
MSSMLSFRTLTALRDNSEQTTALQRLAQEENNLTSKLAKQASEDTKTLKTITILTLIYLPATFVAVSPHPIEIWRNSSNSKRLC